ncbi:hypothetical protein CANMA_001993 [Candida margitis]|uniref:uncharacterized protein n=1 Tax=Candida margitis TaxID=1775924 RepID=UPI00222769A6|nr:uncharacterized protein CANMA_001993 [Candida margitis]KAI5968997.1 hypothetical protein CANMA_001993 [Candida margitis]
MSTKAYLERRNWWVWFTAAAIGGMMVAAAGLAGFWWVNSCGTTAAIATSQCWYAAAGIVVVGGIGLALTVAGGANLGNSKRDVVVSNEVNDILSSVPGVSSVRLFHISDADTEPVGEKRDADEVTIANANLITWKSVYGSHAAAHTTGIKNITELATYIVQSRPASANVDTIDNFNSSTISSRVRRRQNYFDVNYVTWNRDNVNHDLDRVLSQDRGMEEMWEYDQEVPNFFHNNGGWKYCATATVNPNPGHNEGYNDIGRGNAVHGEFYFNTYGGIDGYCNDNKDGAQCRAISSKGCVDLKVRLPAETAPNKKRKLGSNTTVSEKKTRVGTTANHFFAFVKSVLREIETNKTL